MTTLSPAATALLERLCEAGDPSPWAVRFESDENGYSMRLEKTAPLDHSALDELRRAGFLRDIPNGSGWWVNDAGRAAFIKSTDEMGDGRALFAEDCSNE